MSMFTWVSPQFSHRPLAPLHKFLTFRSAVAQHVQRSLAASDLVDPVLDRRDQLVPRRDAGDEADGPVDADGRNVADHLRDHEDQRLAVLDFVLAPDHDPLELWRDLLDSVDHVLARGAGLGVERDDVDDHLIGLAVFAHVQPVVVGLFGDAGLVDITSDNRSALQNATPEDLIPGILQEVARRGSPGFDITAEHNSQSARRRRRRHVNC